MLGALTEITLRNIVILLPIKLTESPTNQPSIPPAWEMLFDCRQD